MSDSIVVFYGSYRSDRQGIRLAEWLVHAFEARGASAELVDARVVGLPMLDRRFKEFAPGEAPPAMTALATRIRAADALVFVTGEYNWSVQPELKNLTDHFLEEWFWRPAAVASYSSGRSAGVRSALEWRGILAEMGMVVVSSTLALCGLGGAFDPAGEPAGEGGEALEAAFPRFADDPAWWAEAAREMRIATPRRPCLHRTTADDSRLRVAASVERSEGPRTGLGLAKHSMILTRSGDEWNMK